MLAKRALKYDCLIIGAGVVGCSTARVLQALGARCAVVDSARFPLGSASGGNSGILCTGYDAPEKSIERFCLELGQASIRRAATGLGTPALNTGAIVLSGGVSQIADASDGFIETLNALGTANEPHLKLSRETLEALQPHINTKDFAANGGIHVDTECVIDSYSLASSWLNAAMRSGTDLLLGYDTESVEPVASDELAEDGWVVKLRNRNAAESSIDVSTTSIIGCAGNSSDALLKLLPLGGEREGAAQSPQSPRKGQYVVFGPANREPGEQRHLPIDRPLQPPPTQTSKGVFVFPSACQRMIVAGPTALDTHETSRPTSSLQTASQLADHARRMLPGCLSRRSSPSAGSVQPDRGLVPWFTYSGLRPALGDRRDYRFLSLQGVNASGKSRARWLSIDGIRSTGLSGSQGIAGLAGLWWLAGLQDADWNRLAGHGHGRGRGQGAGGQKQLSSNNLEWPPAAGAKFKQARLLFGLAGSEAGKAGVHELGLGDSSYWEASGTGDGYVSPLQRIKQQCARLLDVVDAVAPARQVPLRVRTKGGQERSHAGLRAAEPSESRRPGSHDPDGWPHHITDSTGEQGGVVWDDSGGAGAGLPNMRFGSVEAFFEGSVVGVVGECEGEGSGKGAWLPVTHPLSAASVLLAHGEMDGQSGRPLSADPEAAPGRRQ